MSKSSFSIGLLLGVILGAASIFGLYAEKIKNYNLVTNRLEDKETELSNTLLELNQLKKDYISLNSNYNSLRSEKNSLQRNILKLENDLEHAENNWQSISDCICYYLELQDSYTSIEASFSRVINKKEIDKISYTIEEVSRKESDRWQGYWYIHKYVRDEINYAYDPEIPLIDGYNFYGQEYSPLLSSFETFTGQNLIQSLSYTVEYAQGDCDDQAMLEYAMIQYYRKYISGTLYSLYLGQISFENEDGHLAVFMPVVDGNLCILDPAGSYQTGS